ncbi:MAG: hypothetical protein IPG87_12880 [Saprospiraceae bacterium]|nr:hypothetical protein [Candidatus Vicinibacter affinis]
MDTITPSEVRTRKYVFSNPGLSGGVEAGGKQNLNGFLIQTFWTGLNKN